MVAVQIRNSSGTVVSTTNTGIAVKNWLPGTYTVTPSVTLPAGLAAGTYTIAIGIVNPTTMLPDIQLAIQGRDANGWYRWAPSALTSSLRNNLPGSCSGLELVKK